MFRLRLFLILGLCWGAQISSPSRAEGTHVARTILITAFEPYLGRAQNGSREIAEALKKDPEFAANNWRIEVCLLPVEYDRAAEKALSCIRELGRPRMVVSLGESNCELHLETRFHNLDNFYFPDNRSVVRKGVPIVPGGPAELPSTLPLISMACGPDVRQAPAPATISSDPGNFVCNNTAYRLQRALLPNRISYGFIHVPEVTCGRAKLDAATANLKNILLRGAAALPPEGEELPRAPVNLNELGAELAGSARNHDANSCHTLFYLGVRASYSEKR